MWSIEKFGAVSGQGRQATPRASIFLNPKGVHGQGKLHFGFDAGLLLSGFYEEFRPFLTGSAPQTEFDVTHSKQTTEKFLTGARTHFKLSPNWPNFFPESVPGTRGPDHRSRLLPATSHSPLATAVRYNAPCPHFSREACNLTSRHAHTNQTQEPQIRRLEVPRPRSRHPYPHLPPDVSLAPPRRPRNPAQAPEQNLLPDQRRRTRRRSGRRRPCPEAGLRLVFPALPRPRSHARARCHSLRNDARSSRRERRSCVRRPPDALTLGPSETQRRLPVITHRDAIPSRRRLRGSFAVLQKISESFRPSSQSPPRRDRRIQA